MATDDTYNGWTNKATWLVKLWIDNDQGEQEYWLERASLVFNAPYALAKELEETYTDSIDESYNGIISKASFVSDLMSWALAMVDWAAVARSLIEDATEVSA